MARIAARFALLGALLSSPASAADWFAPWSSADVKREAAYLALHTADWAQTRYIVNHPVRYHEDNPLLGSFPSAGRVDRYFLATGLLHVGIAHAPPSKARVGFQFLTIALEAGAVAHNLRIGVRFDF